MVSSEWLVIGFLLFCQQQNKQPGNRQMHHGTKSFNNQKPETGDQKRENGKFTIQDKKNRINSFAGE